MLVFLASMALLWLVFSGFFTPGFMLMGMGCVLLTILLTRAMGFAGTTSIHYLKPAALFYWLWLAKEIFMSALRVTRLVWQAEPRLSPTLAWVPTRQKNDRGKTIFANSITLTPGTVSLDVQGAYIAVHALESSGAKSLKDGDMDTRVHRMNRRVI